MPFVIICNFFYEVSFSPKDTCYTIINKYIGEKETLLLKINMIISLTSIKEQRESNRYEVVIKTFESSIRPVKGDIIDDPGFDPRFHNGYEVVKVTINYEENECFVSLNPLAIEIEEMSINDYIDKLEANGWRILSKEELVNN